MEKKLWLAASLIIVTSLLAYAIQTIPLRNPIVKEGWQQSTWGRDMTKNCMNDCGEANLTFLGYNPGLDKNMCLCWNKTNYMAENIWD